LNRIAVSEALALNADSMQNWQLLPEHLPLQFDCEENFNSFGAN
jgi:hypothetical protein